MRHRSGFTLVEFVIVLSIIGLISAGIVVGVDLIRTAKIRKTAAQVEQFNTAVNAFKEKYGCLPGDCLQAHNFGFNAATDGNGDSTVGCTSQDMIKCIQSPALFLDSLQTAEYINFWYHLNAAGLLPEDFKPYNRNNINQYAGEVSPKPPLNHAINNRNLVPAVGWTVRGEIFPYAFISGTWFSLEVMGAHNFVISNYAPAARQDNAFIYFPADVALLDRKIDDGMPLTGKAIAIHDGLPAATADTTGPLRYEVFAAPAAAGLCVRTDSTPPFQYNIQYKGANLLGRCSIAIKASF